MEKGWNPNGDGILPACPRCGSSNTKFCYYNNYSLTQPRYFCKSCRRYWTKGGSLRNVPIGGGCRKSRRGKSIRVSTNGGSNSRDLAHNSIESCNNPFSSPGPENIPSTSIDLAEVYANFLSPKTRVESVSQMPDGVLGQPVEILNLPNFDSHLPQDSDFLDYGDFPGRLLSEIDGNFQKQMQNIVPGSGFVISNMNQMNYNSASLLLPGEDAVISDGILWPGSDLMLPEQIHETPGITANSEILSGNVSTFSELNLEAIFRS